MKDNSYSKWLDELKHKVDFVGIVSKYVQMKQRGRNFWGCCPFHHEKTPSFSVDPYEGFYHCFGCKEGGDVIRFVQKMENCSFPDAVSMLAKSCNMEVPIFKQDENVVQKKKDKDLILKILDLAAKHYHANIYETDAKKAQDYIKQRGFTRRELDDFFIGYSKNFSEIITYMKKQGFTEEEMLKAGLVQQNTDKKTYYDTQGGRLVFPIYNSYNECIGFTSRLLEKSDYAKYKNTPDTLVFDKSRTVFAINLVKKYKNETGLKNIVIVEGQIDVIAMHRAGFKNTVACMGTALTAEHARELKRFTDKVVLCFDGDGAGTKATLRAIDILRNAGGLDISVVALPEGKDPDELLKEKGKEYLQSLIDSAKPIMDYYIDYELKNYDLKNPNEKGKFVKVCLEHLKKLSLSSEQEPYLAKIRDITGVPIDVLRRDITIGIKDVEKPLPKSEDAQKAVVREQGNEKATKFIMASLLHKKEYIKPNFNYRKLIPGKDYIFDLIDEKVTISSIYDRIDVENDANLADLIYFDFSLFAGIEERYFEECLKVKYEEILKSKKEEITAKFKECEDIAERRKLLLELAEVNKKLIDKNLEDFND